MKFTDGYWQMRPDMTSHYAAQVHDVTVEHNMLTVYAPVGKLQERGHTVNQPLLTVRFSSPMKNVIRVQLVHHKGTNPRKPSFEIHLGPTPQVSISNNESYAMLTSSDLSVRINKTEDWLVDYISMDKVLTSSGWRGMGFVDTPNERYIHEQLSLGVGECVYGLGERFTAFVKMDRLWICGIKMAVPVVNKLTKTFLFISPIVAMESLSIILNKYRLKLHQKKWNESSSAFQVKH